MTKIIGMVVVFIAVSVLLYMGVGMFASVPEPEVGTEAHETYSSLTDIIKLSFNAFWGILLLLVLITFIMIIYTLKT